MKKLLIPIILIGIVVLLVAVYLTSHITSEKPPTQTSIETSPNTQTDSSNIYLTKTNASYGNYMTDFADMTLHLRQRHERN